MNQWNACKARQVVPAGERDPLELVQTQRGELGFRLGEPRRLGDPQPVTQHARGEIEIGSHAATGNGQPR